MLPLITGIVVVILCLSLDFFFSEEKTQPNRDDEEKQYVMHHFQKILEKQLDTDTKSPWQRDRRQELLACIKEKSFTEFTNYLETQIFDYRNYRYYRHQELEERIERFQRELSLLKNENLKLKGDLAKIYASLSKQFKYENEE